MTEQWDAPWPKQTGASYRVQLANRIIDQIEGSQAPDAERLLQQTRRLANASGDTEVEEWLTAELKGYPTQPTGALRDRADSVNRRRHDGAYEREPLAYIEAAIHRVDATEEFNRRAAVAQYRTTSDAMDKLSALARLELPERDESTPGQLLVARQVSIARAVRAEVHGYVSATFHRYRFREIAAALFDRHRVAVDALLRQTTDAEVIDKIPEIYDRLAEGRTESISNAMNSCRRMIVAFTNIVSPARDTPEVDENGNEHELTDNHVVNRLWFKLKACSSKSRRKRLGNTVEGLWQRVSNAVHNDATPGEAQSLFLMTYLTLGEIVDATPQ